MKPQRLDRTVTCYRIGDPDGEHPIFDAVGSTLYPGRWNDEDSPVIYAAEHYATAMLEKLAHGEGEMPANQHYIQITLPKGSSYEMVTGDTLSDWAGGDGKAAREYGVRWIQQRRSLLLFVPCYVARMEHNILINPVHPECSSIETSLAFPVWWDERLFPN